MCTFLYRVPWVPVAPLAPQERTARMYAYWILSYLEAIFYFRFKADFLFTSLSYRVSLENLVVAVSADLLAHRYAAIKKQLLVIAMEKVNQCCEINFFLSQQGARGFPGTPGLPGIKGHRVSQNLMSQTSQNQ